MPISIAPGVVALFNADDALTATYTTIQDAVDAASANFTIRVGAGTYREQVLVDGIDGLTIKTMADAVIEMPDSPAFTHLSASDGGARDRAAVVTVRDSGDVTIEGFTIDGRGRGEAMPGGTDPDFEGVLFFDASGVVTENTVTGIRDALNGDGTPKGAQRGNAIVAINDDGAARAVAITGNTIEDFQKNGVNAAGAGLTATIADNTVTGSGFLPASTAIAQNGIQLSDGAGGVVDGNTVSELGLQRDNAVATYILLLNVADGVEVTNNIINGVAEPAGAAGIFLSGANGATVTGNALDSILVGITFEKGFDGPTAADNVFTNPVPILTPLVAGSNPPVLSSGSFLGLNYGVYGDANTLGLTFSASDGVDELFGTSQNDVLSGLDGDDVLFGGEGDDTLNGGEGFDTAIFEGALADHQISFTEGPGATVASFDTVADTSAMGGTDTLIDIETLEFYDAVIDIGDPIFLVDDGGFIVGSFLFIQDAIDAASDDFTVLVSAGTYEENLTVPVGVTIKGANTGLAGDDEGRGAETILNGTITLAADGVSVDGLTIDGEGVRGSGVRGQSSLSVHSDIAIENTIFTGQTTAPILAGFGFGGGIGSANWTVSNNLISNIVGNSATAIVLFNIDNLTVSDNIVEHDDAAVSGRRGINLDGIQGATVSGNVIEEGGPAGTSWGIQVSMSNRSAADLSITGNTVNGSALAIFTTSQRSIDGLTIADNVINDATGGIQINSGSTAPVEDDVVFTNIAITGNTIEATANAVFVRDLHDNTNFPAENPFPTVEYADLTVTGNTIVAGAVRLGGLDAAGTRFEGELLNVSGAVTVDGGNFADRVEIEGDATLVFNGGEGDDTVRPNDGDDTIHGGGGFDTVVFAGSVADYTIVSTLGVNGETLSFDSVTDNVGSGGTDTLTGIERLVFADATLDLNDPVLLLDGVGNFVASFTTIQDAVNAASDGFTVRALAGTYEEDLTVPVGVTIKGANTGLAGDDEGRGAETVIIGEMVVSAGASFTLDGVEVRNTADTSGGYRGVTISGAGDHTIVNSVFFSEVAGGPNATGDYAVFTNSLASGSVTIADNYFTGDFTGSFDTASWNRAIWLNGGGIDRTVTGNVIEFARTGVNIEQAAEGTLDISGNAIANSGTGFAYSDPAPAAIDFFTDNTFDTVGTDFNGQNLTTGVTFNVGGTGNASLSPTDKLLVLGGDGNDVIGGTDGDDIYASNAIGSSNDVDVFTGGAGDDVMFGKIVVSGGIAVGEDVFAFTGPRANYTVAEGVDPISGSPALVVTDTVGTDGTDYLVNVGKAQFSDGVVRVFGAPDIVGTDENIALAIAASALLANDIDANLDPLRIDSVTDGVGGTVTLDNNATPGDTTDDMVVFTPTPGFSGEGNFSYTVSDGFGVGDTVLVTVNVAPDGPEPVTQTVTVRAAGTGGVAPQFQLVIDGDVVDTFAITTPVTNSAARQGGLVFEDFTFSYEAENGPGTVDIVYINNANDGPDLDRNLYVDKITVNSVVLESEVDGVLTYNNGVVVGPTESIFKNGTLSFEIPDGGPTPITQTLEIRAAGTGGPTIAPLFEVFIGGDSFAFDEITTPVTNAERRAGGLVYETFTYEFEAVSPPDNFAIRFFNNGSEPAGEDRNLYIDFITVNNQVFQAEVFGEVIRTNGVSDGSIENMDRNSTMFFTDLMFA